MNEILNQLQSDDLFALARARAMVQTYIERWDTTWREYRILSVESEFRFPLLNPETGGQSKTFEEAGKLDLLVQKHDQRWIVEHKTTADSIAPDSDFWDRLRMDSQVSKYFLSEIGRDGQGVIYDVISKPGQRPAAIPLLDVAGFKIVHDMAGMRVYTKDGKKPRETGDTEKGYKLQTRPETPTEFEARLLATIRAEPNEYFGQRITPRLDSDILEFMADEWALSQQLLYFRSRKLWPRNPGACLMMGKCEMFDLCCGRASVDSVTYRKRERIHSELTNDGNGKELLTNSRTTALKKCSRYHQLRYEDGIERVQEEAEALKLGSLLHQGLELYFNQLKETQ